MFKLLFVYSPFTDVSTMLIYPLETQRKELFFSLMFFTEMKINKWLLRSQQL